MAEEIARALAVSHLGIVVQMGVTMTLSSVTLIWSYACFGMLRLPWGR